MNRLKEMDFSEYKNYKRPNTEEMNAQGGTLTKLKLDFTSFSQNNTSSLMSSETKNTALHLKDLIEKEIEIWEDYRFVIPKSSFPEANGPVVDLSSLFITQSFDETGKLSRNKDGRSKKLNETQLRQIREEGQFQVASEDFPGEYHTWTLTRFFQTGKKIIKRDFMQDLAKALTFLIVDMPSFLYSGNISIWIGLKEVFLNLIKIPSALFGFPYFVPRFDLKSELDTRLLVIYQYLIFKELERIPNSEFQWKLKGSDQVFDFSLVKDFNATLSTIRFIETDVDLEWKKEEVEFSNKLAEQLKAEEKYSDDQIAQMILDRCIEEKQARLYQAILSKKELYPPTAQLVVRCFRAARIIQEEEIKANTQREQRSFEEDKKLCEAYPIRSLIPAFRSKKLGAIMNGYDKIHKDDALENSIKRLRENHFEQEAYLIDKDKQVREKFEAQHKREIEKNVIPGYVYTWSYYIWRPSNWRIVYSEEEARFKIFKMWEVNVTSSYPFWKLGNFFHRTASYLNNMLFILGPGNILSSSLGIRALLERQPFYPIKTVDPNTGQLKDDITFKVQTLRSRIHTIWSSIRASRTRFEELPDSGFLGKSLARFFNRLWNYGFKGFLGIFLVLLIQPLMTILNIGVSSLLMIASPIFAPVLSLFVTLLEIIIFDGNVPVNSVFFYLYRIFIGIGKFLISILGVSCVPLLAIVVGIFSFLRYSLRSSYDAVLFYTIIRRFARVPARNGFGIRRIKGPGLQSQFYFQISSDLAVLALQSDLESRELDAYIKATQMEIRRPLYQLYEYFGNLFDPFMCQLNKSHPILVSVDTRTSQLITLLQETVHNYRKKLVVQGNISNKNLIRQNRKDLFETLQQGSVLVQFYYEKKIFPYMLEREIISFWAGKHLAKDDWYSLTKWHFNYIFSEEFNIPLEECSNYFTLKVQHTGVSEYAHMLMSARLHDPLQKFIPTMALPTKKKFSTLPYITSSSFTSKNRLFDISVGKRLFEDHAGFKATSLILSVSSGRKGIQVSLKGRYINNIPSHRTYLHLEGDEFWNSLEKIVSKSSLSSFRTSKLPLLLYPDYTKNDILGNVEFQFSIGSDKDKNLVINGDFILSTLQKLVDQGNPSLFIRVNWQHRIRSGWINNGNMLFLYITVSDLLEALQKNSNLLAINKFV